MRVLRDTATVWRHRSSVEAASTKRFVYFPPVGMRAASMWHVHQRPLTLIVWFQVGTTVVLAFVVYVAEAWQEDCEGGENAASILEPG